MSALLDSQTRDALLNSQKEELEAASLSLGRKLQTLYLVTTFVGGASKPQPIRYDLPLSPDCLHFLDINSIAKGKHLDETTLPIPFDDAPSSRPPPAQQTSLRPSSPSRAQSPLSPISNPSRAALPQEGASPKPLLPVKPDTTASLTTPVAATPTPPRSPNPLPAAGDAHAQPLPSAGVDKSASNEVTTKPTDQKAGTQIIAHDPRKPRYSLPKPGERRAKVIHLPPKEEQEQRIRNVEKAQEGQRLRERREDEESAGLSVMVPNDIVSSPSSTAEAYSTSTPKPPQHSPDTSPDAGYSPGERVRLLETTLDRTIREDKERTAAAENSITPEAQLRLEAQASSSTLHGLAQDTAPRPDIKIPGTEVSNGQPDFQTPKFPVKARRSDNLEIDMIDAPSASKLIESPALSRANTSDGSMRRMTRVASGAMRQKSVSEILGEIPKPSSATLDRNFQPVLMSSALSRRDRAASSSDERERLKHSMVVFSKHEPSASPNRNSRYEPDGYLALRGASEDSEKDYLRPLFLHQAYAPPRAPTLSDLIGTAHKTLTTTNMYANIRESFDYRILRRIYQLQNANKWSFRQMARFPDPVTPVAHYDHLLAEMKWMRTDFREERKWKTAAARRMADTCAEYVNSPEEMRRTMRVKAKIPPPGDAHGVEGIEEPPELVHSGSTDSGESIPDDELIPFPTLTTIAPTALFNLGYDDVVFELDPTPAGEGILNELPMYESIPKEPSPFSLNGGKNQLIPVSRFTTGKLVPKPAPVIRKRSRYDYESEDDEPAPIRPPSSKRRASEVSMFLSPARRSPKRREIPPEETNVALFDPINRHIRDRLHANHAFRPPSEFGMPSTSFFESRMNSQWTWDEDQKLRSAVKKFSYNWSLIAMELQSFSQASMFVAATERRTPWECFERWEQLEGLPNDMDKTQYFRTYRSRIQTANRAVEARTQATQQLQAQNGNQVGPVRRRTDTQPFRVQRRKDDRHIVMLDAIRKLARKRETNLHRQQESAKAAALRKQHNEANQAKNGGIHTPQEFSRMKHEREVKMQERQELYRQSMLAQQQAKAQNMQRPQMNGQGQPMPNGAPGQPQRNGSMNSQGPSPPAQMPNGNTNGNMPQRPSSQGMMPNGFPNGVVNGMGMQMPNGHMQGMPNQQQRLNAPNNQDLRMLMAQQNANRQYMQAQGGAPNNNHPGAHVGQTPQMLAALAAQQRGLSNGMGMPAGLATSPRGQNVPAQQPHQLSSGHTPALFAHQQAVMAQFPHFTPDQVAKLANERLKGQMQRMSATALSAASGSPAPQGMGNAMPQMNMANANFGHVNGMAGGQSPTQTQYAAALQRNMHQQAARLGSGSPAMSNARPASGSRSATPQNPPAQQGMQIQRPASAVAGLGEDGSPRMM